MIRFMLQTLILTIAVFISAFLLFMVQPLFAKMILPVFGGSAAVWTCAMLFFQVVLLLGYIYSHLSTSYLGIKFQILLHAVLIFSALLLFPFELDKEIISHDAPVRWVLQSATVTIGWPFFVLATSAPLLQRWFSYTKHPRRDNPYFLYAASNVGSMLALLGYPFFIERYIDLGAQKSLWQYAYYLLAVFFVLSAVCIVMNQSRRSFDAGPELEEETSITWVSRLLWILLAFVPSSLMLGLTSFVTTDIAAVSLFWVLPLALYLLSFIIVFSGIAEFSRKFYRIMIFSTLFVVGLSFVFSGQSKVISILSNTVLFFLLSLYFHGKLAASKPAPSRLTEFYIWLAVGGMMGGIFNAIAAPLLFKQSLEYLLVLFFGLVLFVLFGQFRDFANLLFLKKAFIRFIVFTGLLLILDSLISQPVSESLVYGIWFITSVSALIVVFFYIKRKIKKWEVLVNLSILGALSVSVLYISHDVLASERSFYGSIRVKRESFDDKVIHLLTHGTTVHGSEIMYPASMQKQITTYFHPSGAFGDIAREFIENKVQDLRIGIMGLGAGTLSCYARSNDIVHYFEIDSKVKKIAEDTSFFKYLHYCPAEVIIGDGRVMLQKQSDEFYDILILDVFTSDSVPVHLITQEAIELYLTKIKPAGILVMHISNRYLELKKVVSNYTLPQDFFVYYSRERHKSVPFYSPQTVAIISRKEVLPQSFIDSSEWEKLIKDPSFRTWTDDFTNIVSVLIPPWNN
jgi:spermidine synthase